jgi:biotin carboxyl carrier protein
MEKIIINIDEQEFETEVDYNNIENIKLDGQDNSVKLLKEYGNNVYSFLVNGKVFLVQYDEKNGESKIIHENFEHKVNVKTETKALLLEFMKDSGLSASERNINAPMPGLVVKILCEVGQEVKKGDKLIIIEAMKMENALSAPLDGIVSKINVSESMPVEKDTVMVELEEIK